MSDYPEHEKLRGIVDKSQAIGEFLEWLQDGRKERAELMVPHSPEMDENEEPVYRDFEGNIASDWPEKQALIYRFLEGRKRNELDKEKAERGIECRRVYDPQGTDFRWIGIRTEALLAEYFKIDRDKLEVEKRAMLDECRKANAAKGGGE